MPPPNLVLPKTHSVVVDLNQILINIQRATTYVFGAGETPRRRAEYPPLPEKYECHIDTMGGLQEFLQPALETPLLQYFTRLHKDQRIHILDYGSASQAKQYIVLTPTTILNTNSNAPCSIDQGLAYYLGVGLGITPPSSALDVADATLVGYIRCFGTGVMDCPQVKDFAPPLVQAPTVEVVAAPPKAVAVVVLPKVEPKVEPEFEPSSIDKMLMYHKIAKNTDHTAEKRLIFLIKATQYALDLAKNVRRNIRDGAESPEKIEGLIVQYTQRLALMAGRTAEEEATRICSELQNCLNELFQSPTWQAQYKRFRKDFLGFGCTESPNASGTGHVSCAKYDVQFDINKTTSKERISKAITK